MSMRFCSLTLPAITSLAIFASVLSAQAPGRPEVNRPAADFELTAVNGELDGAVRLSELTADGPVVVVVLRGYPGYQCPICTGQVNQLVGEGREFARLGAKVLFVYPGPALQLDRRADEFVKGNELPAPFTLLIDPNYEFVNAYGLRWDAPRETAYPATLVIGRDGKFKMVSISDGHGGRTTAKQVLAAL